MSDQTSNERKVDVVIIEDHKLLRDGFRSLIEWGNTRVVGEAESGEKGIKLINELDPDVAIIDISMPGIGGIETISRIRNGHQDPVDQNACIKPHPDMKIIVYSQFDERKIIDRVFELRVNAYVSKGVAPEFLEEAIKSVMDGHRFFSPDIANAMATFQADELSNPSTIDLSILSEREMTIFKFLADGKNYNDIALDLDISVNTVKNFYQRIKKKLNTKQIIDLTRIALKNNIELKSFKTDSK